MEERQKLRAALLALGYNRIAYTEQKERGDSYSETWSNYRDKIVITWAATNEISE